MKKAIPPQQQPRTCSRCNGTGDEPDAKEIGATMKKKRLKARKTQTEIASKMGITPQYISDLESGSRLFDRDLIAKFEKAVTE